MKQEIYELSEPLTAEQMHKIFQNLEQSLDVNRINVDIDWFYELREKADKYDEIMAKRKKASEKSKASLMKNMTAEERKARSLKAIQARWGKK